MTGLREFNPHIWLNEIELEEFAVRSALIAGDERVVVWDTLSHPRDMQAFLPLIQNRELCIVYSHADWDHIWGTAGLPYPGRLIVGHSAGEKRFASDVPKTLQERLDGGLPGGYEIKLVKPNLTFQSEISIDLGSIRLNLHTLTGHTSDCIVAFIPKLGILLGGDTFETPFPVINEDSPLETWIAGLQRWADDPRVQTVIPAHGAIGGREIIRDNIRYLRNIREGVDIELPDGLTDFYRQTHQENLRYREQ